MNDLQYFQKMFADYLVLKGGIKTPKQKWTKQKEKEFDAIPIHKLIENEYFLNQGNDLYPEHYADIIEIFERKQKGEDIRLFLDSEAIGSGKTHKAAVMLWISLFKNIIKIDFQEHYPLLGKGYGLAYMCTSWKSSVAKDVTFEKVLPLFLKSPFFVENFPPDVTQKDIDEMKRKPDRLMFPNRVLLFTESGTLGELGTIGFDLIYSVVDEVNFFEVVESSKRGIAGGTRIFDAADELINNCLTRIPSRFLVNGKLPPFSLVHALSARRGKNDFLDKKMKETADDPSVISRFRAIWDAKPAKWRGKIIWSGEKFKFDTEQLKIVDLKDAMKKYEKVFGTEFINFRNGKEEGELVDN